MTFNPYGRLNKHDPLHKLARECRDYFEKPDFHDGPLRYKIAYLSPEEFDAWRNAEVDKFFDSMSGTLGHIKETFEDIKGRSIRDSVWAENTERVFLKMYQKVMTDVLAVSFYGIEPVSIKQKEWLEYCKEHLPSKLLEVEVDGVSYKASERFDILCDAQDKGFTAWSVEADGAVKLVIEKEGVVEFVDPAFLENRIKSYQKAIQSAQTMLTIFKPLVEQEHVLPNGLSI